MDRHVQQISKYETVFQKFQYTKLYRAPKWLFRKLLNQRVSPEKNYEVEMSFGHKIKLRPTQMYLKAVIFSGQYHDDTVFFLRKFLSSDAIILDIGANIGLYSCAYAQYFQDLNIKVFAIEAVRNNFNLLKSNIDLNNFKNIQADNIALGKEEGELVFNLPSENFVGNAVSENIVGDSGELTHQTKVKMIDLDSYAKENNITKCDFIKMDVEGAEYFIMEGGRNFIKELRPVIQAEFNLYWMNQVGITFQDYVNYFSNLNYAFGIEKKDSIEIITDIKNFTIIEQLVDLYFIPQEKLSEII